MSRIPVLAVVCAIMALNPGAARAQTQNGFPLVTRDSSVSSDRGLALTAGTTSAPLRFEQSLVGSDRLGISPPPVPDAVAARDPLAAFQGTSLRHRGPGVALMLVGAAAIVTGLLIDESLITILGAGTGLVGLYLYLR